MSAFAEFVLVAILIYLWESTLWLPLRGVVLRKRWSGSRWKAVDPRNLFATRELGLIPMLPFPPDGGLAPCQSPPLWIDDSGSILMETTDGRIASLGEIGWDDVKQEPHHLLVGNHRTRLSSSRCVDVLRRAKQRGCSPEAAIHQALRQAFSPTRAGREWKRWKRVSGLLRFNGPVLTFGFFVGLPLMYLYLGNFQTLVLAGWLWCMMASTACQLWWLGKRVYPGARAALRTDALLSLLVPFHAMRAMEIASVHAMGTTHPVGLILSSGDLENPWLGQFVRKVLHPARRIEGDMEFAAALRPFLVGSLARIGAKIEAFDVAPDWSLDESAASYCPRCHAMFLAGVESCGDCRGIGLRSFHA